MVLIFDDRGSTTKLKIIKGRKVLLKKTGTFKSLLKYVFVNSKKDSVRKAIEELKYTYQFMIGGKTKIRIEDDTRN